jgi:hypothetical protein
LAPEALPKVIESPKGIIDTGAADADPRNMGKQETKKIIIEWKTVAQILTPTFILLFC